MGTSAPIARGCCAETLHPRPKPTNLHARLHGQEAARGHVARDAEYVVERLMQEVKRLIGMKRIPSGVEKVWICMCVWCVWWVRGVWGRGGVGLAVMGLNY